MKRFWQHAFTGKWHVGRLLRSQSHKHITECIAAAEKGHSGQIRVVIEATPGMRYVLSGCSARERALQVFARERVWDTPHNNGVLLYLLVAERDAEIVADRGLNDFITPHQWQEICQALEREVPAHGFVTAVCNAIHGIGVLLRDAFPAEGASNELSDDVVIR
jgi:uncharacterized membrane protein